MRSEEFIKKIQQKYNAEELVGARENAPLGVDNADNLVFARKGNVTPFIKHICVTGIRRTAFVKRYLLTLFQLYDKRELNVFILSTKTEYGELLRLQNADITVPYIHSKQNLEESKRCLDNLLAFRDGANGCPYLVLVLDGLEELQGCNSNGDLEEYRDFIDMVGRRKDVEIVSGVDLMKSIFSGYPGAYVGVGNCLVTTREEGKADITYVGEDATLSMPTPMSYPSEPSITETVIFFNAERGDV